MVREAKLGFQKVNYWNPDCNLKEFKFKRHYFAKFLIERMSEGYRIINLDESAIQCFSNNHRSWVRKGSKNKFKSKLVNPRVTLVTAIDSNGNKYMSLL
jgi:hypothetical protein